MPRRGAHSVGPSRTRFFPAHARADDVRLGCWDTSVSALKAALDSGSELGERCGEFLTTYFPEGAAGITNLEFEDQLGAMKEILGHLEAMDDAQALEMHVTPFREQLGRLVPLFEAELAEPGEKFRFDILRKARDVGHENLCTLIATAVANHPGRDPDAVRNRGRLLSPIVEQNERVRLASRVAPRRTSTSTRRPARSSSSPKTWSTRPRTIPPSRARPEPRRHASNPLEVATESRFGRSEPGRIAARSRLGRSGPDRIATRSRLRRPDTGKIVTRSRLRRPAPGRIATRSRLRRPDPGRITTRSRVGRPDPGRIATRSPFWRPDPGRIATRSLFWRPDPTIAPSLEPSTLNRSVVEVREAHLRQILAAQREIMACGPDLQRVMDLVVRRTQGLTGANGAAVELVEGEVLVYRAGSGTAEPHVGLRLAIQSSLSGRCVRERRIMECPDAKLDERVDQATCARIGVRSMVVVPLFHEGTCVGVLKVMSQEPGCFDGDDVALLELMGGFIAAAMGHAQAQRALAASEQSFRVFAEMAEDGIITLDDRGRVVFVNQATETMFGYSREAILGDSLIGLMPERHREALAKAMARRAEAPSAVTGQTLELEGLRRDGREFPIEVSVSSFRTEEGKFYAGIVRDVTQRKALEQAALDALRMDPLTRLLVRSAGSEVLEREAARAHRYVRALGICLFDIDHFKRVNDVHGHAAGDAVLSRVGEALRQTIRVSDVAIRWGGEELLLATPETGATQAIRAAERVRRAVEVLRVEPVGSVTISGGVATHRPGEPIEETIARADASLYEAKSRGRNRIVGE